MAGRREESGEHGDIEVCLNIWFIIDEVSKLIYRAAARAYVLSGSEEQKANTLKLLASADFHLASHFSLSWLEYTIVDTHGIHQKVPGIPLGSSFDAMLPVILDRICIGLEKTFITQPVFTEKGLSTYTMNFSESPLHVITFVYEDRAGRLMPRL